MKESKTARSSNIKKEIQVKTYLCPNYLNTIITVMIDSIYLELYKSKEIHAVLTYHCEKSWLKKKKKQCILDSIDYLVFDI